MNSSHNADTPTTPKPKRKLASKVFGWILLALGILQLLFGSGILARILFAVAFGLPGLWLLLHARRESAGAAPLKKHWGIIIPIAVAALFGGSIASPLPEQDDSETRESTKSAESTTASTATSSRTAPISTSSEASAVATTSSPMPTDTATSSEMPNAQETTEMVVGFTEAPGQATPTPMDKIVESCGDVNIHERGTTFFTDGTSGWTQECADQMIPAPAQQFYAPPVQEQPAAGGTTSGTCKEIGHKTYVGDGIYMPKHDRDGDGVGCESYPG